MIKLLENSLDNVMVDLLESNLVDHAKEQLKIAGLHKKDSDYNGMLYKAIVELMETLANQGHSGMSLDLTLQLFGRLARFKPITEEGNIAMRKKLKEYYLKMTKDIEGRELSDVTEDEIETFLELSGCGKNWNNKSK